MKTPLLLTAALALATPGFGQNANAPGQAKKTDPVVVTPVTPVVPVTPVTRVVPAAPDLTVAPGNLADAETLAKGNNIAGAEQKLTTLNRARPNTAGWHMETAQRLVQTAEQVAREGQPGSVPALAASALSHLDLAVTLARDARTQAAARTLAGFIQERYLANPTAALTSYQAAAQLSPTTATKAAEAADRLQKTDDNLKDKLTKGSH